VYTRGIAGSYWLRTLEPFSRRENDEDVDAVALLVAMRKVDAGMRREPKAAIAGRPDSRLRIEEEQSIHRYRLLFLP
jgi:hypothetical protein